jgi:predicted TIM-barrel fold metal-dependent hydrolase
MVVHIHLGGPAQGVKPRWFGFQRLTAEGSGDFFGAQRIATATGFLSHLMFSGVFDRHPNLKVVCTEYDVGWVAIMFEQANYRYGRATAYGSDVKLKMAPGDYMKRHAWFTFQDDRAGMLTTPVFGADNFMWASDYPHGNTTWPYSHETMERLATGVSVDVKRKVGRENANRLYRMGL